MLSQPRPAESDPFDKGERVPRFIQIGYRTNQSPITHHSHLTEITATVCRVDQAIQSAYIVNLVLAYTSRASAINLELCPLPGVTWPDTGAGDGNRTRTVSLGS